MNGGQPREKSSLEKLTKRIQKTLMDKLTILKITYTGVSYMLDLSKDLLILIQISFAQGVFSQMMSTPKPYIRWVLYISS